MHPYNCAWRSGGAGDELPPAIPFIDWSNMHSPSSPSPSPSFLPKLLLLLCALAGMSGALAEDLSTSSGAQLFQRFCASCHGRSGEGNGPVAPFFKLAPPDLTLISRRSGGKFPAERTRRIIEGRDSLPPHGPREMPVWGMEFAMTAEHEASARAVADANIARLVEYLRTIQKK
jgi:mono/diheme cytochrome c family protein